MNNYDSDLTDLGLDPAISKMIESILNSHNEVNEQPQGWNDFSAYSQSDFASDQTCTQQYMSEEAEEKEFIELESKGWRTERSAVEPGTELFPRSNEMHPWDAARHTTECSAISSFGESLSAMQPVYENPYSVESGYDSASPDMVMNVQQQWPQFNEQLIVNPLVIQTVSEETPNNSEDVQQITNMHQTSAHASCMMHETNNIFRFKACRNDAFKLENPINEYEQDASVNGNTPIEYKITITLPADTSAALSAIDQHMAQAATRTIEESNPGASTSQKSNLKRARLDSRSRMNWGTGLICVICDRTFGNKSGLTQHLNKKHSEPLFYRCEICGKRFGTEEILQSHILRCIAVEKEFKCSACPKQFHHNVSLLRHIDSQHKNGSHQCSVCGKRFARKDHMIVHQGVHERRLAREQKKKELNEYKKFKKRRNE